MANIIEKIQTHKNNYLIDFHYYNRARDAIFDCVNILNKQGYKDIYIPGYIGWSPKEGSGIFDPLNAIIGLDRHYYHMSKDLLIDKEYLFDSLKSHSILLIVNYFGFRDPEIDRIIEYAHKKECIVIEDNAHGFYTYFCNGSVGADMTVFSLHKMFPFEKGGGLIVESGQLDHLNDIKEKIEFDPFRYDYNSIAKKRIRNYELLLDMASDYQMIFEPLRGKEYLRNNIPQTFPVILKKGDRNKMYAIMNDMGYGVVSLYHTMIEELRNEDHKEAFWLSQRIMNLPVHQDVDDSEYLRMMDALREACSMSEGN